MQSSLVQQITFGVLALVILGSALAVVGLRNIFHRLLFLALSFLGVAGIYLTLSADFLAAVQVLVYVGAIIVLMMFALMMTGKVMTTQATLPLNQWWLAPFPMAVGILVILLRVYARHGGVAPIDRAAEVVPTTEIIGRALLTKYVLPFELASIVLLVAMVGAIVLAKEEKPNDRD